MCYFNFEIFYAYIYFKEPCKGIRLQVQLVSAIFKKKLYDFYEEHQTEMVGGKREQSKVLKKEL
jgi:hypothetical protein